VVTADPEREQRSRDWDAGAAHVSSLPGALRLQRLGDVTNPVLECQ